MGKGISQSTVRASLKTSTVLQQTVEKSLALESENSRLRHHVSVLSRRLHEVIVELKKRSKITAAFCPVCGGNHNQVNCEYWQERVEEEKRRMEGTDFGGVVDVAPMIEEEEVAVVVRLPEVATGVASPVVDEVEGVAGVGALAVGDMVAEDVGVVAEEVVAGVAVGEAQVAPVVVNEEEWMEVRRKVRAREEMRRRMMERTRVEKVERENAVRAGMNGWRPARSVAPLREAVAQEKEVVLRFVPKGPRLGVGRTGVPSGPRGPGSGSGFVPSGPRVEIGSGLLGGPKICFVCRQVFRPGGYCHLGRG